MSLRLLIFFLCSSSLLNAQHLSLISTARLAEADDLVIDQFENRYLIHGAEIRKLDPQGNFIGSYSDPLQGTPLQLDLLNPMNPLLYFQNVGLAQILDNRLNPLREHNLSLEFLDPLSVALASEDALWLYDQNNDRMVLYSLTEQKTLNRSPSLGQILGNLKSEVIQFSSGFDRLVVLVRNEDQFQVLIFDGQASLKDQYPLPSKPLDLSYHNGKLVLTYPKQSLEWINLETGKRQIMLHNQEFNQRVFYFHPFIFLWDGKSLSKYRLEAKN